MIDYYIDLGVDYDFSNPDLLCSLIQSNEAENVEKVLELGATLDAEFECNPFEEVSKEIRYHKIGMIDLYDKVIRGNSFKNFKKAYQSAIKIEGYLLDLMVGYPRKKRKDLEKQFSINTQQLLKKEEHLTQNII